MLSLLDSGVSWWTDKPSVDLKFQSLDFFFQTWFFKKKMISSEVFAAPSSKKPIPS
jgi:hypothetical protein